MKIQARFAVAGQLASVPLVRRRISALLSEAPPQVDAEMVALCAVEALTNCIRHGRDNRAESPITLTLTLMPSRIVLTVADTGRPMDRRLLARPLSELEGSDPQREGGRGLLIMRKVMNTVAYKRLRGVNTLTMTLRWRSLRS